MANLVVLYGNLGADPELRMGQSGTAVLKLRIATNERVKKGEEWVDHTEWHSVTTFGKRAEGLAKILTKGSKVAIQGKLRTTSYEKDGVKKYNTEIVADEIELGGGSKPQEQAPPTRAPEPDNSDDLSVGNSDIPF